MKNRKTAVIVLFTAAVVLVAACGYLVFSSLTGQEATPPSSSSTAAASTSIAVSTNNNGKNGNNGSNGKNGNNGSNGNAGAAAVKGIFQFSSHNAATNVDNPAIQGTNLIYYWAQLEPQQGQYNWAPIDQAMQPWVAHNKKVILRISASGWTQWDKTENSGHATPQWVYNSGVQSVTEIDNSVHPQYWNPKFLSAYQDFISALAQRYDNNPAVAAIQMSLGDGGETKVDTRSNNSDLLSQWEGIGYTDAVWWDTMQKIIGMYTSNFHHVPLSLLPDSSFIGKTKGYGESLVIDYAVSHNLWLQDDGLITDRQLDPRWMKVPHIEEQRQTTSQSGDTLQEDLQAALNVKATYILIFAEDINSSANAGALQNAAKQLAQQ